MKSNRNTITLLITLIFLISIPDLSKAVDINIYDQLTMLAIPKDLNGFYLIRPGTLSTVNFSKGTVIESSINFPKIIDLRPNIISVESGGKKIVFMRSNDKLYQKDLNSNSAITDSTVSGLIDNYQLVHIGSNRLIDTEIESSSILMYLLDYQGNKIKQYKLEKAYSIKHYVLRLRGGGIVAMGFSGQLDTYTFDDELNFKLKGSKTINTSITHLKAFELESNVIILCYISSTTLQCLPGDYSPDPSNAITWRNSAVIVSDSCADEYWYQVLPLGDTGQAIAVCGIATKKDFRVQKFNARTIRGGKFQPSFKEIFRLNEIMQFSKTQFGIISFSHDGVWSWQRLRIEPLSYPSCDNYSLDILINDRFPIYQDSVFASQEAKVSISSLPKEGTIIGFDDLPVQLDVGLTITTVFFKRGLSGTYYFSYEIVDSSGISSPCKVTVIVKCHSLCETCKIMGDDTTTDCLSCFSGGLMPYDDNDLDKGGNCKSTCDAGYYVEGDLICRKCYDKCLTCNEKETADNNKCLTCPPLKYWFEVGNTYNCLDACPKYYYSDSSNHCLKCHDACESCKEGGTVTKHNCLSCPSTAFYLPLDYPPSKYNCYDSCPEIYFIVGKQCTKCYKTCSTCSNDGIESEQNCESCLENLLFLPQEDKPSIGNCLQKCPSNAFAEGINCLRCYEACETCDDTGSDVQHTCLTCPANKKILKVSSVAKSGNCVSKCISNSFEIEVGTCIKCFPFCPNCSMEGTFNDHNCLTCSEGLFEFALSNGMNNCVPICPEGYYSGDGIKCTKCYSSCASCNKGGTEVNHRCGRCKEGYEIHHLKPTNCVIDCKRKDLRWLFNAVKDHECTLTEECPIDNPIFEPKLNQCVQSCTIDPNCIQCAKETLYQHKTQCLKECPEYYQTDANKICQRIPVPGLGPPNSSGNYESSSSKEDFINDLGNIIEKSLDDIKNSGKNDSVIVTKNDEYEYIFYPSGTDVSGKSNGSSIDLGKCEPKLRQVYLIPDNEEIFIGQIIFPQKGNQTNVMQYAVYDARGRQLNLDVCKDIIMQIGQKLNIEAELIEEAERLMAKFKIDAFDPNSVFYSDACFNYTDLDMKDYTLEGRRAKFIDDKGFCIKDCTYVGINFDSNEAKCDCKPSQEKISPSIDSSQLITNLLSSLPLSNMEIFTCFNKFFHMNILANYGLMSILAVNSVTICFFVIYFFVQMPIMYSKCSFIHLNPPVKGLASSFSSSSSPNSSSKMSSDTLKEHKLPSNKCFIQVKHLPIFKFNQKAKADAKAISDPENYESIKIRKFGKVEEEGDLSSVDKPLSTEELNEMEYKEAIVKDKRPFCKYYWSLIKEKEIVLSTFASDDPLNPVTQRVFVCFYIISAYLFVSALFYSDAFIAAESYFDITFIFSQELEKSFYSAVIIKVISKCINLVMSLGKKLRKAFRDKDNKEEYEREAAHLLNDNKRNTIILFAVMIITEFAVIYYISIFCILYPNNQLTWFASTVFTIVFNLLLSGAICLAMTGARFISFIIKKEWVYKVSGYIGDIM